MPTYPNLADIRRSFAGLVRHTPADPYVAKVRADLGGAPSTDAVVDAAMQKAADGWGAVNQPAGARGAGRLSKEEIKKLTQNDPLLGALTAQAAQIAFRKKNPVAALDVKLDAGAPAGLTVQKSGADKYTIAADPSVAVGTASPLVIDGQELALSRGPAGLTVDDLVAPAGYGLEVVSRSLMTDPTSTATVSITRDDPA